MPRLVATAVFAVSLAVLPRCAAAQEPLIVQRDAAAVVAAFAQTAALDARQLDLQLPVASPSPRSSRVLASLLVSTVMMQALDVHSTFQALDRGGVEANPVMAPLAGNRGAFIATKAAVATATVLAARHLGKRNKVAAIATLVAVNSAYALVIDHNYRVARGLR